MVDINSQRQVQEGVHGAERIYVTSSSIFSLSAGKVISPWCDSWGSGPGPVMLIQPPLFRDRTCIELAKVRFRRCFDFTSRHLGRPEIGCFHTFASHRCTPIRRGNHHERISREAMTQEVGGWGTDVALKYPHVAQGSREEVADSWVLQHP